MSQVTSENAHGNATKITGRNILDRLEFQKFRCALSGMDLTPETASLDHVIPLSRGGKDDMSNVQIVHSVINAMKGTLSEDEFVKWCYMVVKHKGLV